MKSFAGRRRSSVSCSHDQTVVSVVAGLERTVCESCGHVSVKHRTEAVTRGGVASPRY